MLGWSGPEVAGKSICSFVGNWILLEEIEKGVAVWYLHRCARPLAVEEACGRRLPGPLGEYPCGSRREV